MSEKTIAHRRGLRRRLLAVLIMLGWLGMVGDRAGAAEPEEISPHLYVFISSSLPMASLIAIAKDAAFGFYYADDLAALAAAGAELLPFDTMKDAALPPCDALFIGGGFPESFLDALSANVCLREEIRHAIAGGLPTYAECGGLMYLANSITWRGQQQPMVGAIDGHIVMHDKPIGRGYVILEPQAGHPWRQEGDTDNIHRLASADFAPAIHAHEFHYSEILGLPENTRYAYAVKRGHGVDGQRDGILIHNLLASYTHLRGTAGCDWPTRFVRFIRACRANCPSQEIA